MRRIVIVVLLAGSLAACSSSKPSATAPTTTSSTVGSTSPADPAPKFDVVLDDKGLTFPAGKTLARSYLISFEDRRTSPPAGQNVHLQFLVSGPQLLIVDLAAGASIRHLLLANTSAEVVNLDPGEIPVPGSLLGPDAFAHRHSIGNYKVINPLNIEATPEYPTPVT
jgi:hypothetical protein